MISLRRLVLYGDRDEPLGRDVRRPHLPKTANLGTLCEPAADLITPFNFAATGRQFALSQQRRR